MKNIMWILIFPQKKYVSIYIYMSKEIYFKKLAQAIVETDKSKT